MILFLFALCFYMKTKSYTFADITMKALTINTCDHEEEGNDIDKSYE